MKKYVIMPDSFKGTMSSSEICSILRTCILQDDSASQVDMIPVADGGEGTVDSFLHALPGAERIELTVSGPYMEQVQVYYARQGKTAIVEMAQAAGLPLVEGRANPAKTTTYGVGEMIRHAVTAGCTDLVIGLGGSCTNDGGVGMAQALGTIFRNVRGETFLPTGGTLAEIAEIDNQATKALLQSCRITAMCDIDNPMYGPAGAAYIFAPQKGAGPIQVEQLDQQLRKLDETLQKCLQVSVAQLPGAGAAGALGAGIVAFLGGELKPGIQVVLDLVCFEQRIADADMILTGEGKIDTQSLRGKVVIGIARRAKPCQVPVVAIVGDVGDDVSAAYDQGVTAIFSINRVAVPFEKARLRCKQDLADTMDNLLRFQRI